MLLPVSAVAAASDKVKVTPLILCPIPTSEKITAFCPPGPTSRTSTSATQVWVKPRSVTVTVLIAPPIPETLIVDGYGVAFPTLGIVINAAFVQDCVDEGNDGFTVNTNVSMALKAPSLTVTVMVALPV